MRSDPGTPEETQSDVPVSGEEWEQAPEEGEGQSAADDFTKPPPAVRRRADPPSRPVDAIGPGPLLMGKRKGWHYVFANPADEVTGLGHYLGLGYEIVTYDVRAEKKRRAVKGSNTEYVKNAVRPEPGEPIMWRKHVLVRCPPQLHRERLNSGDGIAQGRALNLKRLRSVYDDGVDIATAETFREHTPRNNAKKRYFTFKQAIGPDA